MLNKSLQSFSFFFKEMSPCDHFQAEDIFFNCTVEKTCSVGTEVAGTARCTLAPGEVAGTISTTSDNGHCPSMKRTFFSVHVNLCLYPTDGLCSVKESQWRFSSAVCLNTEMRGPKSRTQTQD